MATSTSKTGAWGIIGPALIAILLTGGASWVTFGRNTATQGEVDALRDEIKALHESIEMLNTTMSRTNDLLNAHGITFENLIPARPHERTGQ